MVVINGKQFNLIQLAPNKYVSRLKSAKEAQELAQTLRKLDKEVRVKVYDNERCSIDYVFNYKPEADKINRITGESIGYGEIELTGNKGAFDCEYTAEQALQNNWATATGNVSAIEAWQKSTINLADMTSFIKSSTVGTNGEISEMDKSQYLDYVRENGLEKEIDWNTVSEAFKFSVEGEDFTAYTDYAAALYASLEQRINNDFFGTEKENQLKMLNTEYNNAVQKLSVRYVNNLKRTFDFHGIEIPEEKISQSITDIMNDKKQAYCDYADNNSDYAKLSEENDQWLSRDIKYMAGQLRSTFDGAITSKSAMSESDIVVLGLTAQNYYMTESDRSVCYPVNLMNTEESLGLALSANYLASYELNDSMKTSEEVRAITSKMADKYAEYAIDNLSRELEFCNKYLGAKSGEFTALNTAVVESVINTMKTQYSENKDTAAALLETAHFAYKTYTVNAANSSAERYHHKSNAPETDFWKEFYDDGRGTSFLGKMIDKWNAYATAADQKDYAVLSQYSGQYFAGYKSLICGLYRPANLLFNI